MRLLVHGALGFGASFGTGRGGGGRSGEATVGKPRRIGCSGEAELDT
jgi:hypothetical protein